jgi:hypothetical protein
VPRKITAEIKEIFSGIVPTPPLSTSKVVAQIMSRYSTIHQKAEIERRIIRFISIIDRLSQDADDAIDEEVKQNRIDDLSAREVQLALLMVQGRDLWKGQFVRDVDWVNYCFRCVSADDPLLIVGYYSHLESLRRFFSFPHSLLKALGFGYRKGLSRQQEFAECDATDLCERIWSYRYRLKDLIADCLARIGVASVDELLKKHALVRDAARREYARALAKCGDAKWIETLNAIALVQQTIGLNPEIEVEEDELGLAFNTDKLAYELYQSGKSWSEVRDRVNEEMKDHPWEEWTSDSAPRKAAKRWLEFNPKLSPLREARGRKKRKSGTDGN